MRKENKTLLKRILAAMLSVTLMSGVAVMTPIADIVGTNITAHASENIIAQGRYWKLTDDDEDDNYKLTFFGTIPDSAELYAEAYEIYAEAGGSAASPDELIQASWLFATDYVTEVTIEEDTKTSADASYLFSDFWDVTSMDLSNLDTSNATDMEAMFSYCSSLTSLNLSGWDTSKVENMSGMFYDCNNLETIIVGNGWNTDKVISDEYMFDSCASLVGGKGTKFADAQVTDKTYARIDGGPASTTPGYFTKGQAPLTYTVTWQNTDGTLLEKDENITKNTTPSYDGTTPSKTGENGIKYVFTGWSDGTTTYAPDALPAVTGNVTYTAVYDTLYPFTVTTATNGATVTVADRNGNAVVIADDGSFSAAIGYKITSSVPLAFTGATTAFTSDGANYIYTVTDVSADTVAVTESEWILVSNANELSETTKLANTSIKIKLLNDIDNMNNYYAWENNSSVEVDLNTHTISVSTISAVDGSTNHNFKFSNGKLNCSNSFNFYGKTSSFVGTIENVELQGGSFFCLKGTNNIKNSDLNCTSFSLNDGNSTVNIEDTNIALSMSTFFTLGRVNMFGNVDINFTSTNKQYVQLTTNTSSIHVYGNVTTNGYAFIYPSCEGICFHDNSSWVSSYDGSNTSNPNAFNNPVIDALPIVTAADDDTAECALFANAERTQPMTDDVLMTASAIYARALTLADVADVYVDYVTVGSQPTVTATHKTNGTPIAVEVQDVDTSTPGIATATVKGTGKYKGTVTKDFTVLSKDVSVDVTRKKTSTGARVTLSGEWLIPEGAEILESGVARVHVSNTEGITKEYIYEHGIKKSPCVQYRNVKMAFSINLNKTAAQKKICAVTYVKYKIGDKEFTSISDVKFA